MTDTNSFLQNTKGVSSSVMYNLKPSSVPARSYKTSVPPSNASSFQPGSLCVLYVPAGRRSTFLSCYQTYLNITVQNNSAVPFNLDNNASCFINRIDIFSGSNLIESVQQYNVLYSAIADVCVSSSNRIGLQNNMGFGTDVPAGRSGSLIGANQRQTFSIPLALGSIGVLAEKMLPLYALGSDIRIEITFENNNTAVAWSNEAVGTWSIINVGLELSILELSDQGMEMVKSYIPKDNVIYFHSSTWRHFVSTLPAATAGTYSTLIPVRNASVKSIMILPRRSNEIIDPTSYGLSSRINPNFASFQLRLGSAMVPQQPIQLINQNSRGGYSESFAELLKSWHSFAKMECNTCLPYTYYNVADVQDISGGAVSAPSTLLNSYKNGFMIQLELESFSNKSDVILSGTNLLNCQSFFEATINTSPASTYTLDSYAWFDQVIICENGVLSVKF